jgi:hypothetical protein
MYDLVFYSKTYLNTDERSRLLTKHPYAKIIKFSNNLTQTALVAKTKTQTDHFWLIDATSAFFDSMLKFKPDIWDSKFIHVFNLRKEFSKPTECFLISRDSVIDESQEYFSNVKYINQFSLEDLRYDIFFLSYNEPNRWENWEILQRRFPNAKIIDGVSNIYLSHKLAAEQSSTDHFFVVDADNEVLDSFDFNYFVEDYDFDLVHIWHSRNEINDLEYGNGAIKLFPKILFESTKSGIDISTSLSNKIKIVPEVASINRFASSPWNAWRSAFRETAKLASGAIKRSDQAENQTRLTAWCTKGLDRKFGEYVIPGANAGAKYGFENKENQDALSLINNWSWLYEQFNDQIKLPYRPE